MSSHAARQRGGRAAITNAKQLTLGRPSVAGVPAREAVAITVASGHSSTRGRPRRHRRGLWARRGRLGRGMSQVFALAAFASLDAGLLTAAVALLGRPRPARQLLAYLVGGMGLSIGFGLPIVLALHGSKLQLGRTTQAIVELAAGALLILVALAAAFGREMQWHPRRTRQADTARPQRKSLYDRAIGHDSLWIAWAAGALYSVPGAEY